jgi:FtsZ-binding cell division protein ZapB
MSLKQIIYNFLLELKESKTRIDQLQGLELTTQELKAKIICLEQSLSDKQRETENVRTELEQLKKEQKEKTKSLSQESTEAKDQLIQVPLQL